MFWNNGEKGISTLADYEAVRSASGRVAFLHILPFLGILQIRFLNAQGQKPYKAGVVVLLQ